eukprot:9037852-Karenia_brevis.AAC.1
MGSLCAAYSAASAGSCQGCTDPSCTAEKDCWELGVLGEESEEEEKPEPEHRQPAVYGPRFLWEWTPE